MHRCSIEGFWIIWKNIRKFLLCALVTLLLTSSVVSPALAMNRGITVLINGTPLALDAAPIVVAGRTMVPLRAIANAFGANLSRRADGAIVFAKGTRTVILRPNRTTALVNGEPVRLDLPVRIAANRTMVPLRFMGEVLNAAVSWNPSAMTVAITSKSAQAAAAPLAQTPRKAVRIEIASLRGRQLFIGMSSSALINTLGEPDRREPGLHGYDWWVFNSIPEGLLLAGIAGNALVAVYTDSPAWKIAGIAPGDSYAKLTGMHTLNAVMNISFQGAQGTISQNKESPLVIKGDQALTFYLDSGRNKEIAAIRITDFRSLLATGDYAWELSFAAGSPPDVDPPRLSVAQQAQVFIGQERIMFDLVNSFRVRNGLRPLSWHDRLAGVAREHSFDMSANDFFSHLSPTTAAPFDRLRRANISFRAMSENIALISSANVLHAHHKLLNSPGHRQNILFPAYTHLGVGVVGKLYTQNFITE